MNKLISVIIPYYKKKPHIKKTLNSVVKQTYKKIEIIIVYDDLNRSDLSYIHSIVKKNNKVKIVVNRKNLGAGKSRNIGINHANGDYIAFIDADDVWKKNKLEKQINFMEKYNISISHTSYRIYDYKNKFLQIRKAKKFSSIKDLIGSCDIGLSTVILKKKIIKKNKFPNLKTKEDFVYWLNFLKMGHKIYPLETTLTNWKKTRNSLSSNFFQKIFDSYRVYRVFMKFNVIKSLIYIFILSKNYIKKSY